VSGGRGLQILKDAYLDPHRAICLQINASLPKSKLHISVHASQKKGIDVGPKVSMTFTGSSTKKQKILKTTLSFVFPSTKKPKIVKTTSA
jgi:hypothetical protein